MQKVVHGAVAGQPWEGAGHVGLALACEGGAGTQPAVGAHRRVSVVATVIFDATVTASVVTIAIVTVIEKTKAQRGRVTCSRSPRASMRDGPRVQAS